MSQPRQDGETTPASADEPDASDGFDDRPLVGVSACLLGERVRYDGGHRRNEAVVDHLARTFRLLPVCPEVGIGLGTPRETLHLVQVGEEVRLRTTETARDLTAAMEAWAHRQVDELAARGVAGFVCKSRSPSCGVGTARRVSEDGHERSDGTGVFARVLRERLPDLPVVEEGPLQDRDGREAFLARVRAYGDGGLRR